MLRMQMKYVIWLFEFLVGFLNPTKEMSETKQYSFTLNNFTRNMSGFWCSGSQLKYLDLLHLLIIFLIKIWTIQ